jgi:hypothetical protein
METLTARKSQEKPGTEVIVDVTAEMARVSQQSREARERSPENTMDFNQELDTIVEGVQHKNLHSQGSVLGPEGAVKAGEERTLDEFFDTLASK